MSTQISPLLGDAGAVVLYASIVAGIQTPPVFLYKSNEVDVSYQYVPSTTAPAISVALASISFAAAYVLVASATAVEVAEVPSNRFNAISATSVVVSSTA